MRARARREAGAPICPTTPTQRPSGRSLPCLAARHGLSVEGIRSAPYRMLLALGKLMEIGAAVIRSPDDPPLTRTLVRMIGREFTTDDSAARREARLYRPAGSGRRTGDLRQLGREPGMLLFGVRVGHPGNEIGHDAGRMPRSPAFRAAPRPTVRA